MIKYQVRFALFYIFCNFNDENGHLLDKAEMINIQGGTYRLVLTYGLDNEYVNKNAIYSNEFIIK